MLKPVAKHLAIGRLVYDKGDQLVGAVSTIDSGGAFTVAILGGAYRWPGWMEGWNVSGITGISTLTIFELARRLGQRPRRRGFWLSGRVISGYRLSASISVAGDLPHAYTADRLDGEWIDWTPVMTTEPRWRGVRAAARHALNAINEHAHTKPHKRSRVVRVVLPNRSKK